MGRTKLVGAAAAVGLAVGTLSAVSVTASAASAPESHQQQPECLYKNDSGNRQPVKNRPKPRSATVAHVARGDALWGPCVSTTDGGGYKACGPGRWRVWTKVYRESGWIKTRCFDRLR